MPSPHVRIRLQGILPRRGEERGIEAAVPGQECQVREGALVADEPGLTLEGGVEDAEDAMDFFFVALDGRGELLRVEDVEPARCINSIQMEQLQIAD